MTREQSLAAITAATLAMVAEWEQSPRGRLDQTEDRRSAYNMIRNVIREHVDRVLLTALKDGS